MELRCPAPGPESPSSPRLVVPRDLGSELLDPSPVYDRISTTSRRPACRDRPFPASNDPISPVDSISNV